MLLKTHVELRTAYNWWRKSISSAYFDRYWCSSTISLPFPVFHALNSVENLKFVGSIVNKFIYMFTIYCKFKIHIQLAFHAFGKPLINLINGLKNLIKHQILGVQFIFRLKSVGKDIFPLIRSNLNFHNNFNLQWKFICTSSSYNKTYKRGCISFWHRSKDTVENSKLYNSKRFSGRQFHYFVVKNFILLVTMYGNNRFGRGLRLCKGSCLVSAVIFF